MEQDWQRLKEDKDRLEHRDWFSKEEYSWAVAPIAIPTQRSHTKNLIGKL